MADTYLTILGESTIGTYLGLCETAAGDKTWIPILDYPEMIGAPNTIEVTDLSDRYERWVLGVQGNDIKDFTANFDATAYTTLKAFEGKTLYCYLWFGDSAQGSPDGSQGKFSWQGQVSIGINSGEVNGRREMVIHCVPTTGPTFSAQ